MTNNYYQKDKERLRKKACKKYQNFTEEEKEKKRQYHQERNKQKQKLVEYERSYHITHKK